MQSVLGTSATQAGITITPMLLGWVTASIIGMRLLLKVGYRRLGLVGTATLIVGAFLMTLIGPSSSQALMMVFVTLMGIGMGLSIPSFLIAVQTSVERRHLGTATSMLQFSRSMGGTLGVSVMGAALSLRLIASGLDAEQVSKLLDPVASVGAQISQEAAGTMANAMHGIFVIGFVAALLGPRRGLLRPAPRSGGVASTSRSRPRPCRSGALQLFPRPPDRNQLTCGPIPFQPLPTHQAPVGLIIQSPF